MVSGKSCYGANSVPRDVTRGGLAGLTETYGTSTLLPSSPRKAVDRVAEHPGNLLAPRGAFLSLLEAKVAQRVLPVLRQDELGGAIQVFDGSEPLRGPPSFQ